EVPQHRPPDAARRLRRPDHRDGSRPKEHIQRRPPQPQDIMSRHDRGGSSHRNLLDATRVSTGPSLFYRRELRPSDVRVAKARMSACTGTAKAWHLTRGFEKQEKT